MATYKDLIDFHADFFEIPKTSSDAEIRSVMHTIRSVLLQNGEVVLPEFGKLTLIKSPARKGRDPRTGDPVDIPEKMKVRLRVFKSKADVIDEAAKS